MPKKDGNSKGVKASPGAYLGNYSPQRMRAFYCGIITSMERIILHIDLDAFFASAEERENPHFRGKPIVVGADPKDGKGRGVVSTANYKARKFGVHSAMPISQAFRHCPQCVFLPVDSKLYHEVSERIFAIVRSFISKVEVVSIDEAYGDLTHLKTFLNAKILGVNLKKEIFKKEKIHSTVGIASNKMIAKLATNSAKPDGLRIVEPKNVQKFLDPLDVGEVPGVGPKTRSTLHRLGFRKVEELRKVPKDFLVYHFGKWGAALYDSARGIGESSVEEEREIKSIGRETTFEKDTRDSEEIFKAFENLLEETFREAKDETFHFRTISVKCRFSGFETHTKDKTLKTSSIVFSEFKKTADRLLLEFLLGNFKAIRLIGVRIS